MNIQITKNTKILPTITLPWRTRSRAPLGPARREDALCPIVLGARPPGSCCASSVVCRTSAPGVRDVGDAAKTPMASTEASAPGESASTGVEGVRRRQGRADTGRRWTEGGVRGKRRGQFGMGFCRSPGSRLVTRKQNDDDMRARTHTKD